MLETLPLRPASRIAHRAIRRAAAAGLVLVVAFPNGLHAAQAAIDPNVPPRAAALERQGERHVATDLLGRYLAVAPDDGRAWFQLGRFYLLDARDWHSTGHGGDPDGLLYLEFAATAFDQAVRLHVDSGGVYRSVTEMERALIFVEDSGWALARARRTGLGNPVPLPGFLVELGTNLLNSCPADGVLLTGGELETLAVWHVSLELGGRPDVVPLRPELYATDPHYRRQMSRVLAVDSALPVQGALTIVAARRTLCLGPAADTAAVPAQRWLPYRLVRVSRPAPATGDLVTLTELLQAVREGGSPWTRETLVLYGQAARFNSLLCGPLVRLFRDSPPAACRP